MATPQFQHVLIIGATSGIGGHLARTYHAQGKKVIATGRRAERLAKLKEDCPGVKTYQFDVTDSSIFEKSVKQILNENETIDTVVMMSGIGGIDVFLEGVDEQAITSQVNTNVTAPMILARVLVPIFKDIKTPTNIVFVTSGLGYVPLSLWPIYSATKAAIHTFAVVLRQQVANTPINVIELIPPYIDTEFDAHVREKMLKILPNARKPTPLNEYMEETIKKLEERVDGKPLKEISYGFASIGHDAWRGAFDPVFERLGISTA